MVLHHGNLQPGVAGSNNRKVKCAAIAPAIRPLIDYPALHHEKVAQHSGTENAGQRQQSIGFSASFHERAIHEIARRKQQDPFCNEEKELLHHYRNLGNFVSTSQAAMQATSYADSSLSLEAVGPRGCRGAERGRKLPAPPHARAAVRKQALRLQNNRKQSMTRPASELKDIDEDEQERRDDEDTALDDQGQPIYTDVTHSFSVGNLNEWHDFLVHQMRLMQGIYSKKVLGKVLNMVENNQRRLYPYNSKKGHARSPPWWPEGLVYIGPDHQKTNGRAALMKVLFTLGEEDYGKDRLASWAQQRQAPIIPSWSDLVDEALKSLDLYEVAKNQNPPRAKVQRVRKILDQLIRVLKQREDFNGGCLDGEAQIEWIEWQPVLKSKKPQPTTRRSSRQNSENACYFGVVSDPHRSSHDSPSDRRGLLPIAPDRLSSETSSLPKYPQPITHGLPLESLAGKLHEPFSAAHLLGMYPQRGENGPAFSQLGMSDFAFASPHPMAPMPPPKGTDMSWTSPSHSAIGLQRQQPGNQSTQHFSVYPEQHPQAPAFFIDDTSPESNFPSPSGSSSTAHGPAETEGHIAFKANTTSAAPRRFSIETLASSGPSNLAANQSLELSQPCPDVAFTEAGTSDAIPGYGLYQWGTQTPVILSQDGMFRQQQLQQQQQQGFPASSNYNHFGPPDGKLQ